MLVKILLLVSSINPILKGICIGLANLIPGVSGGTVAVLLGIYDRLIFSLNAVFTRSSDARSSLLFLTQILIGVLISVAVFSKVLLGLIASREVQLSFLFIGFIIGSIPTVLRYTHSTRSSTPDRGSRVQNALAFIAAFGLMVGLSLITPGGLTSIGPVWISSWWYLALSGVVAAASMVIPGLSGSLMLIIMGSYHLILKSVQTVQIEPLIPFMGGVLLGFVLMVRGISWCLTHHLKPSLWAITGFLCGSILSLWHPVPGSFEGIKLILFVIIGYTFVEKFNRHYSK